MAAQFLLGLMTGHFVLNINWTIFHNVCLPVLIHLKSSSENIACNLVISSYETERLSVRGAVTLPVMDPGNEDDLPSCHHIRALHVVGVAGWLK